MVARSWLAFATARPWLQHYIFAHLGLMLVNIFTVATLAPGDGSSDPDIVRPASTYDSVPFVLAVVHFCVHFAAVVHHARKWRMRGYEKFRVHGVHTGKASQWLRSPASMLVVDSIGVLFAISAAAFFQNEPSADLEGFQFKFTVVYLWMCVQIYTLLCDVELFYCASRSLRRVTRMIQEQTVTQFNNRPASLQRQNELVSKRTGRQITTAYLTSCGEVLKRNDWRTHMWCSGLVLVLLLIMDFGLLAEFEQEQTQNYDLFTGPANITMLYRPLFGGETLIVLFTFVLVELLLVWRILVLLSNGSLAKMRERDIIPGEGRYHKWYLWGSLSAKVILCALTLFYVAFCIDSIFPAASELSLSADQQGKIAIFLIITLFAITYHGFSEIEFLVICHKARLKVRKAIFEQDIS